MGADIVYIDYNDTGEIYVDSDTDLIAIVKEFFPHSTI